MFSDKVFRGDYTQRIFVMLYARTAYWHLFHGLCRFCQNHMASLVVLNMHTATSLFPKKAPITCIAWQFYWKSLPRAGSGAVSKLVICACDSLVDFGAVWMWLICIFVVLTFPICIFPSSFFMRLTFSSISSSVSYLPEYWTRSVSRQEVVGGDQTWV